MSRSTKVLDLEIKARNTLSADFQKIASSITHVTGSVSAFIIALSLVIIWGITAPIFNFSDTWQLVIITGTTIITFLMVIAIPQCQNKDSMALLLKLNEVIACDGRASNRLIDIKDLSQEESEVLKKFYLKLSDLSEKEKNLFSSHSTGEAEDWHSEKMKLPNRKKPTQ